jgi:hypothetical protein
MRSKIINSNQLDRCLTSQHHQQNQPQEAFRTTDGISDTSKRYCIGHYFFHHEQTPLLSSPVASSSSFSSSAKITATPSSTSHDPVRLNNATLATPAEDINYISAASLLNLKDRYVCFRSRDPVPMTTTTTSGTMVSTVSADGLDNEEIKQHQQRTYESITSGSSPMNGDGGVPPAAAGAVSNLEERNGMVKSSSTSTNPPSSSSSLRRFFDPTRDYSSAELDVLLSELQVVDMKDELMDPIEWTIRKIIPIPAVYYWELIDDPDANPHTKALSSKLSTRIKVWHNVIASCASVQRWSEQRIAQPIATATGLTGSKFYYVTDAMTPADIERSKQYVQRRLKYDNDKTSRVSSQQQQQIVVQQHQSGDDTIPTQQDAARNAINTKYADNQKRTCTDGDYDDDGDSI